MYKILIVDDEVLVRVGLKTTIDWEALGFTIVAEAANGEQGYENYLKYKPDVVFTDIKMPKQDGLWLVEKIRQQDTEAKILVLTCYDEFSFARKALKAGADDYILKSEVEDEELIRLMEGIKEKLDSKNKAKAILESSLTDVKNLKSSVFSDLLKKNFIIDDKLQKSLIDLNFPVSDTSFAFIGISIRSTAEAQTEAVQVNDAVMNILYEQLNQYSIAYADGQLSGQQLLFISSPKLNATELKRILTFVANGAKQYFDVPVNAVYSTVFGQLELTGIRFKEYSEKAQVLFYGYKSSNFIRQSETISLTEPNVFELKKLYNRNYIEEIGYENLVRAKELLQEMGHYFEQQQVSPMTVKLFYSNLMGDLFSSYGLFLSDRDIFDTHEAYHYKIIHSDYLEDINKLLVEFSSDLINKIQDMRFNNSKFMINQVLNYIEYHYTEDISLEDVAKEMNLSKNYLCAVFKKETGENMSLYINKLRIEKAKQLLLESDVKIKELFEEVGYSNQQYFSKIFKKITGKTILEYKEGMGKSK